MAGFAPEVLSQLALQKGIGGGGLSWGGLGGVIGDIYFVHFANGLNTNPGTVDLPFQTIRYALDQCHDNNNDYVFVLNGPNALPEVFPITVSPIRVHLIGLTTPAESIRLQPYDDTAALFIAATAGIAGYGSEIAGFDLSGGATHGCIEVDNPFNVWIHDCKFGSILAGGTPQDGIRSSFPHNFAWSLIERCMFFGSNGGGKGNLSRYGITNMHVVPGSPLWNGTEIRNCEFLNCLIGIYLRVQDMIIRGNAFLCCAEVGGEAITLTSAHGCLVADNKASDSKADPGAVPWADNVVDNAWTGNQSSTTFTVPT